MQCRIPMQSRPCLARATFSVPSARSKLCFFFHFCFACESTWKGAKTSRVTCHRCGMCNNVLSSDRSRQFTCQVAKMSSTPRVLCKGCKGMIWYSFWWARSLTLRSFVVQFTRGTNRYYQFLWRTSFILIFDILIWTYGTWLTMIDFKFCCGFFLVCPCLSWGFLPGRCRAFGSATWRWSSTMSM